MYGATRYLYNNFVTSATGSSQAEGIVTGTLKEGLGSAELRTAGTYTGSDRLVYTLQIDSVAAGKEVGQATYRWRESSQAAGVWNATGVTTHTTLEDLNNGVKVKFISGAGDDFEGSEIWQFKVIPTWGIENFLDFRDRGLFWRSDALDSPTTITIDLGSAQNVKALVIFDHNLTSGATITLKGDTDGVGWDSPDYSTSVTWAAGKISKYINQTYHYWQIEITDSSNPDGYIEIGALFLGNYLEVDNSDWEGTQQTFQILSQIESSDVGVQRETVHAHQEVFELPWDTMSNTDVASIRTMLEALKQVDTGKSLPLFFHLYSDVASELYLVAVVSGFPRSFDRVDINSVSLTLEEVPASRV